MSKINMRPLNRKKYKISKNRFLELYYFCLQYNEWKDELKYNTSTIGGINHDGMPHSGEITNATMELASRRVELQSNCEKIEQTAKEADPQLYQYILKAVTNKDITYNYLRMIMNIPCSHNTFYERRRKFYWLLSLKK